MRQDKQARNKITFLPIRKPPPPTHLELDINRAKHEAVRGSHELDASVALDSPGQVGDASCPDMEQLVCLIAQDNEKFVSGRLSFSFFFFFSN